MWLKSIPRLQLPQVCQRAVSSLQKSTKRASFPFPTPAADFEYHRSGFQSRMSGWELHQFGDFSQVLEYHNNLRVPKIEESKEIIVRVRASSVNPLDVAMSGS